MGNMRRGEVYDVDLQGTVGSEKQNDQTAGTRPCVVVQNDTGNLHSRLTIVAPITDVDQYKRLPIQVCVSPDANNGLIKDSIVECGHLRSVDECRLKAKRGVLNQKDMDKVNKALRVSLGL